MYGFLVAIIFGNAEIKAVSIVGQVIIVSITLSGIPAWYTFRFDIRLGLGELAGEKTSPKYA
ncbi:hypothetical protein [Bacillus sp. ISL-37]|uniref:hypothetical protein n=1 Tax=Bacillus sp. ISL-37 TaxID=2819123 RepID=UPI001BEB43BD|nr:hypothetical protein [Bacillus sp. ISL-37]